MYPFDPIENPTALAIIHYLQEQLERDAVDTKSLIHHADPAISKMVADILSVNIDISDQWRIKYSILIDELGSNFVQDAEAAVAKLKMKHLEKLLQQNQLSLNTATTDNEVDEILKLHKHLQELQSQLTQKYGTVILK